LKILVALSRFPLPADKGDKLRALHQICGLAAKHEVHLFCLTDEPVQQESLFKLKKMVKSVHVFPLSKTHIYARLTESFFGTMPLQIAYFSDKSAIKAFRKIENNLQPDLIYCQLARMAEFCKKSTTKVKILDYQDAFSKGLERRLQHESMLIKPIIRLEHKRLKQYEADIFDQFTEKTIISAQDRDLISHHLRKEIKVIPNGVDTDYYKPQPGAKVIDLLFTGNMHYEPNVNCVLHLINQVFPLLAKEYPHLQLVAAGKDPSRELRQLKSRQLQLTGWVDDLRKYYQQSRLFVAPMQIGIGMQNKILEAMAMGLPVITSSLANNAIGARHGEEIWIADTPEKVAEGISYLLNNTELALKLGRNGRELMVNAFSWNKQNEQLLRLIGGQAVYH